MEKELHERAAKKENFFYQRTICSYGSNMLIYNEWNYNEWKLCFQKDTKA